MSTDASPVPPDKPIPYLVWRYQKLVWRSSEQSIAAGYASVLAVAEVFFSIALYWWLATHFDRLWMVFVGLVAAPMLLLRSPKSIEMGVAKLRRYCERDADGLSRWETTSIILISTLTTGVLVYRLAESWLPGFGGWDLFWRSAAFGTVAGAIAAAAAVAVAASIAGGAAGARRADKSAYGVVGVFAVVGAVAGAVVVAGKVAGAVAVVGSVIGAVAGLVAGGIAGAVTVGGTVVKLIYTLLLILPATLGILLRCMFIRWVATLHHLPSGLARLPQNWRENLLLIDFTHPPELLPQAGRVAPWFTVSGVMATKIDFAQVGRLFKPIILAAWYLPSLAYRWSLKASAGVWWPLALALSSPLEGMDDRLSREKTSQSVSGVWHLLVIFTALMAALLFLTPWPMFESLQDKLLLEYLSTDLSRIVKEWIAFLSPVIFGVRHISLGAFCLLALYSMVLTKNLKASHAKVLETPKEFNDLQLQDKERFLQLARRIEKFRILLVVAVLVLGEAYAISFLHSVDPILAEKLLWPWLLRII